MAEPTKNWNAGDQVNAADLNQNFTEALNNYRDFTYGETIAVNDALYLKASDGKVYKTDADFDDERIDNFIGFAKEAGVLNDVKKIQVGGKVSGFTGLTVGADYYLSNTPGAISTPIGTYRFKVGKAISSTELLIKTTDERTFKSEGVSLSSANSSNSYSTGFSFNINQGEVVCAVFTGYLYPQSDVSLGGNIAVAIQYDGGDIISIVCNENTTNGRAPATLVMFYLPSAGIKTFRMRLNNPLSTTAYLTGNLYVCKLK